MKGIPGTCAVEVDHFVYFARTLLLNSLDWQLLNNTKLAIFVDLRSYATLELKFITGCFARKDSELDQDFPYSPATLDSQDNTR